MASWPADWGPSGMNRIVRIDIRYRDDGGIVIGSPDLHGLFLSGDNHDAIWADLGPAIQLLVNEQMEQLARQRAAIEDMHAEAKRLGLDDE